MSGILFGVGVLAALVFLAGYLVGTLASACTAARVSLWGRVGLGLAGFVLAAGTVGTWLPQSPPIAAWVLGVGGAALLVVVGRALCGRREATPACATPSGRPRPAPARR